MARPYCEFGLSKCSVRPLNIFGCGSSITPEVRIAEYRTIGLAGVRPEAAGVEAHPTVRKNKKTGGVSVAIPRRLYPQPCGEPHPGLPGAAEYEGPSLSRPNRKPITGRCVPL